MCYDLYTEKGKSFTNLHKICKFFRWFYMFYVAELNFQNIYLNIQFTNNIS